MAETTCLRSDLWKYGSYPRGDYNRDVIYGFYRHRDISIEASVSGVSLTDGRGLAMLKTGLIDQRQYEALLRAELMHFADFRRLDPFPCEELYAQFESIRLSVLGEETLKKCYDLSLDRSALPAEDDMAVDEREKRDELLSRRKTLIFALLEPKLWAAMRRDMLLAAQNGAELIVLTGDKPGIGIPTADQLLPHLSDIPGLKAETLPFGRSAFDLEGFPLRVPADAVLFLYGEEGFLQARGLSVAAVVTGFPRGFFAAAVAGCLDRPRFCVAFIPARTDIIPCVPLTAKTRLDLRLFAEMRQKYGAEIDRLPLTELYARAPARFLNPYGSAAPLPIPVDGAGISSLADYDRRREEAVSRFLNGKNGLAYRAAWFDAELREREIPWDAPSPQDGILVHAVRTKKADGARVISFAPPRTIRETLKDELSGVSLALISNFLFFFTPRLADLYNRLRADRPREQLRDAGGHLDYLLVKENGGRRESFPLYRKSLIAFKADGRFLFVNFRLGGGCATIGGQAVRWRGEDVDCPGDERPVIVYTPYLSRADEDADKKTYLKTVGEGRLNFVIVQDRIALARFGDVALPSIGVVLSLNREEGEALTRNLSLTPDAEGYFDAASLPFSLVLDNPEGVDPRDWQQVEWAYGGGLTLMLDGHSVYGEGDATADLSAEGWLTPLSRQTQESDIHTLARHPRTAVGVTWDGDLFIMVFSGRTALSRGADYAEMCRIAKHLFPDVRSMMNVDGGGSSVLGMTVNGEFMELSLPSTSNGSIVSMVRPINTALCVACE